MIAAYGQRACRLVLASVSPRRKQILREAGFAFEAIDPGEVEDAIAAAHCPESLAIAKARAKAEVVVVGVPPPYPVVVVAVDTLVAHGDTVIGKPQDRTDAVAILSRLSGTRHRVISGLCLWPILATGVSLAPKLATETTWVKMRKMSAEEIAAYVASGEADGKAGAYAVQETGDRFVEKIEGSFLNIVGFPLELFKMLLSQTLDEVLGK
ncbi:MAG: Maf family protein [Planctomycetota bacterium]